MIPRFLFGPTTGDFADTHLRIPGDITDCCGQIGQDGPCPTRRYEDNCDLTLFYFSRGRLGSVRHFAALNVVSHRP